MSLRNSASLTLITPASEESLGRQPPQKDSLEIYTPTSFVGGIAHVAGDRV